MRVLVTGGNGRLGRFVVEELAAKGHEVASLDIRKPDAASPGVKTILGDASKMEDAFGALNYIGAEALVHFGAWSDPGFVADSRTYADNVSGTFNLLDACTGLGITRAIVASSAQVYGFAEHSPVFAPADESHPLRPLNSYALSKVCGEQVANYFAARKGMEVASFRIMAARAPEDLEAEISALKSASPDAARFLLWNRTDARDIARACELALTCANLPSGPYNITAKENALGIPAMELLAGFCPDTRIREGIPGCTSILSTDKARAAFGYEAIYR